MCTVKSAQVARNYKMLQNSVKLCPKWANWYYVALSMGVGGISLVVGKEWDNYVALIVLIRQSV